MSSRPSPKSSHPPIVYPVAAVAGRDARGRRAPCSTTCAQPAARAVFEAQGFIWLGE